MIEIQLATTGQVHVARIAGEMFGEDAESFTDKLYEYASGNAARLILDLSELTSIDSRGLAAMTDLVTRARLSRGHVVLVAPTPFVMSIFNTTHLDQWFEICADITEATGLLGHD